MEPAEKLILAVGGVVMLAAAGVITWALIRQKRKRREVAEHDRVMKERAQQPEPPARPQASARPSASESRSTASESRPTASEPQTNATQWASAASTDEPAPSVETVDASQPAANERPTAGPPIVIVDNRKRRYPVSPGTLIQVPLPTLDKPTGFTTKRGDVEIREIERWPNRAVISLHGASGQVNVALIEQGNDPTSGRVVTSWKFELKAA